MKSPFVLSVNLARPHTTEHTNAPGGVTGIDKRPTETPVAVAAPGSEDAGVSGLAGDTIGDRRHHGGDDQAVYAFAREDLDAWETSLGRTLPHGVFGENLTTALLDVNGALLGERWSIGPDVVLEVSGARTPCRTFAGWLGERGWVRTFTERAAPGAYLRVIRPGEVRVGDRIEIVHRPDHTITVSTLFRALTLEPELLPRLMEADDALHGKTRDKVLRRAQAARTPAPSGER